MLNWVGRILKWKEENESAFWALAFLGVLFWCWLGRLLGPYIVPHMHDYIWKHW